MAGAFRRIATEEAYVIPEVLNPMRDRAAAEAYDPDLLFWSRARAGSPLERRLLDLDGERLEIMDQHGVDVQVISLASTGVQMFEAGEAGDLAAKANDVLADAIVRHPTRYAGLGAFAPQDPEGAAREIERCARELKFAGMLVNSHTGGEYLDEAKFGPILAALEAEGMPLYIHPRAPAPAMAAPYRQYTLEHAIWGFQAETGLHAVRMIVGGVFDRFPNLKVILGHGGEGVPYWLTRIDAMHKAFQAEGRPTLEMAPSAYFLRNFFITTSGMNAPAAVKFGIEAVGSERMMFAIDYPFCDTAEAVADMDAMPISDEDKANIYHRTAERVFRIPAA